MATERLNKHLARLGVASRRAADELIRSGRVSVNGATVSTLGTLIDPDADRVALDGAGIATAGPRRWYLFHKPFGVLTTMRDPQGRPSVAEYAGPLGGRLFPVGRLDVDAEGALLLTDDGELAHRLLHPRYEVPRTYLAEVRGCPSEASLDRLRGGVRLEDGPGRASEAVCLARSGEERAWVKLVVTEGRQHYVKRLCSSIGHPCVRLFRPSHAGISVEGLAPGALRALTEDELELLRRVAGGEAPPERPAVPPPPRRPAPAPRRTGA